MRLKILRLELIGYPEVMTVPGMPDFIVGMISLRGWWFRWLTETDLNGYQGMINTVIIIVQVENEMIGMIVDSVADVVYLKMKKLSPSSDISTSVDTDSFRGNNIRDDMVILLDVDHLLSEQELVQLNNWFPHESTCQFDHRYSAGAFQTLKNILFKDPELGGGNFHTWCDCPEKFQNWIGCPDPGADAEDGWTDLSGKADEIQADAGGDGQFLYPGRFRNRYAESWTYKPLISLKTKIWGTWRFEWNRDPDHG